MADSDVQADPPDPSRLRKPRTVQRDREEDYEDEDPRPRKRRRDRDYDYEDRGAGPSAVETLIPYHNPLGLIAYYLGVFAFIPVLGLLLGPAAVVLGILGLRSSYASSRAGGAGHSITGIILGGITTLGWWGLVAFIVMASMKR